MSQDQANVVVAAVIATIVVSIFTVLWNSESFEEQKSERLRAESFLKNDLRCTETNFIVAGSKEYARVFECESLK